MVCIDTGRLPLSYVPFFPFTDEAALEDVDDEEGGTDRELERHKDWRAADRIMPDDKVLALQSQPFDDSEEDSEGDREEHQQAHKEVLLKATLSSQTRTSLGSTDIASPNTNPEDITSRDVTPHHSRAGIVYGTPPEVGVLRTGGGFSRRAPRESKVKHEVFEGAEFNAIDTIPASTALGVQLEGNHIKTSKAGIATFDCSTSGAIVASAAAAAPAVIPTAEKASRGKSGGKKFSYVNDTAWLRATPGLRMSTASSPRSDKATSGIVRPSQIQRDLLLGSTCFDSLNTSEDGCKQDLGYSGGREGALTSPSPTPGWGLTKLTEMEQQLQRDLIAAAYPEAETGIAPKAST